MVVLYFTCNFDMEVEQGEKSSLPNAIILVRSLTIHFLLSNIMSWQLAILKRDAILAL